MPLRTRKQAASTGLAKLAERAFSKTKPTTPAGTVPASRSQASLPSGSPVRFLVARVRTNPLITPAHSLLKKMRRAVAVPRCSTTKKGKKVGLSWSTCQPKRVGRITPWPRLETGKISVVPCNNANQKACQMLKTRVLPRKV
jgi:hypothetical protein